MRYGFGVDLGGTTVKLALFDQDGQLLSKWETPTRTADSGAQILPDIKAAIDNCLNDRRIPRKDVIGVGIGLPGPVDGEGNADRCINLGWAPRNIHRDLEALLGLPVKAGNDATNAALGECWKGGHNCNNMVFVTLGTGVGGGIVIDGRVLQGFHGCGGEIGHIPLRADAPKQCNCGKFGCAELYCSARGLADLAENALAESASPSSLRAETQLTAKAVFDAGKAGDPLALTVLDRYYRYLAEFLAGICQVVDPEVVVLGGGVSRAGQMLIDGIEPYFRKLVTFGAVNIRFRIAALGNDAGVYGAFRLLLDSMNK